MQLIPEISLAMLDMKKLNEEHSSSDDKLNSKHDHLEEQRGTLAACVICMFHVITPQMITTFINNMGFRKTIMKMSMVM